MSAKCVPIFDYHSQLSVFEAFGPVHVKRFEDMKDVKEICLEENAYFPLKEYFFRKEEVLFNFDGKKFSAPKVKVHEKVFFGVRRCDLNAIKHQDIVFKQDAPLAQ